MAKTQPTEPAPALQPPGAGLPWWELAVARLLGVHQRLHRARVEAIRDRLAAS